MTARTSRVSQAPQAASQPLSSAQHPQPAIQAITSQSSLSSQAPTEPKKSFISRCMETIIWILSCCGLYTKKPNQSSSSAASQAPVASPAQGQATPTASPTQRQAPSMVRPPAVSTPAPVAATSVHPLPTAQTAVGQASTPSAHVRATSAPPPVLMARPAPSPVAAPETADAMTFLAQISAFVDEISQEADEITANTLEYNYQAKEARWRLLEIKEQLNQSIPEQAQILTRINQLDVRLMTLAGMARQAPLDFPEMSVKLSVLQERIETMNAEDEDDVEIAKFLRNGDLFLLNSLLDPLNPAHLPLRVKVLEIYQELDEFIGDEDSALAIDVMFLREALDTIARQVSRATLQTSTLSHEERQIKCIKLKQYLEVMKRAVHPLDQNHEEFRNTITEIQTNLTALETPLPILRRAQIDIDAAEESRFAFIQVPGAGVPAAVTDIDMRHELKEIRWRLKTTKALLSATEATQAPLIARIDQLEGVLRALGNWVHVAPVNIALLQERFDSIERTIDSLRTSFLNFANLREEAGRIEREELFILNEALDPSDPAHAPFKERALRLYLKLTEVSRKYDSQNPGNETRPTRINLDFATTTLTRMRDEAQGLPQINPPTARLSRKDRLKDELGLFYKSIHPHAGAQVHQSLRLLTQRTREFLDLVN